MDTSIIRRILSKAVSGVRMLFVILLWALFLTWPVFILLFANGWHRPFHSLEAMLEMRGYLEETCAGQDLRVDFPGYGMIGDDFSAAVRDGEGQVLFFLCYDGRAGVTEAGAVRGRDGNYYMSTQYN